MREQFEAAMAAGELLEMLESLPRGAVEASVRLIGAAPLSKCAIVALGGFSSSSVHCCAAFRTIGHSGHGRVLTAPRMTEVASSISLAPMYAVAAASA
ncbi:hypothetical protein EMIHUDRAFT_197647 [Emiliania huxleyi CCMP1516]|uniref:Uncharacterized protein n=2 Tax=Emiliania huxleyi TaxID=2903 RepID=A0A0D3IUM3_EMIH1|nr:hypothetical protein EMIHUDRAFT_197647 [Emiliania huxleyi CCMP1516]EOD14958.1 hypothetical protein EMIHUDRAFT_197647 [Emiliania huxleyi CCMP1516]|eukprot:XP_005767387.1 hypothetical protein EMIHUDRAFT_197647 [Emiliania huxleyi CCMP1516]